jgi:hypothetical protein
MNPILHTAWLDNHALTVKKKILYTAKYYIGEHPDFCITS